MTTPTLLNCHSPVLRFSVQPLPVSGRETDRLYDTEKHCGGYGSERPVRGAKRAPKVLWRYRDLIMIPYMIV